MTYCALNFTSKFRAFALQLAHICDRKFMSRFIKVRNFATICVHYLTSTFSDPTSVYIYLCIVMAICMYKRCAALRLIPFPTFSCPLRHFRLEFPETSGILERMEKDVKVFGLGIGV